MVIDLEDKRKNLVHTQQRKIVAGVIDSLNQSHPSFYYLSTVEIAGEIKKYINEPAKLSHDHYELVKDLSREDIQMLLSFHGDD